MCVVRSYTNGSVMYDSDRGPLREGDVECDAEGEPIKMAVPDRDAKAPDLVWPRNEREQAIIGQQKALNSVKFDWYCFGVGLSVASLFWAACFHFLG